MFPHNIGLGCANDKILVQKIAAATAAEVKATGLDWTFAPCWLLRKMRGGENI